MGRMLALLLVSAGLTVAQTYQPDYFLLAGGSYDYYGQTPAGLTSFGARIADKTYSLTSMDIGTRAGNTAASMRTGIARVLAQPGNFTLMGLGDAGITTAAGVNLGNFGGGAVIAYDLGQAFKKDHFYVAISCRLTTITSQQVKPVYAVMVGKTF